MDIHGRPARFSLDHVHHGVVIVLVDSNMARDQDWNAFLVALAKATGTPPESPHLLIPVTLSSQVFKINPNLLNTIHYIRLHEIAVVEQARHLGLSIMHELCRLLLQNRRDKRSHAPVQLFLSHAKQDGLTIAQALKNHLCHFTPMGVFFDARDIAPGHSFAEEIEGAIDDSALIAIQTDAYASRDWCQKEVLDAKCLEKPVLVVNAVQQEEERQFPYLGNTPSIRWQADDIKESCQRTVAAILTETLRMTHASMLMENLLELHKMPSPCQWLSTPPELVTLLTVARLHNPSLQTILYPDPPLGSNELALLKKMRPHVAFLTPNELAGRT
ncbi:MAG: toll/interleukin-1 receptor domain-containing protein [Magnetococcales bacterium]|nr:toll/interleukin-1 receptor domain-containing protein [Magnetococcales bacterium]